MLLFPCCSGLTAAGRKSAEAKPAKANDDASPLKASAGLGFDDFRLILDRNIFSPTRTGKQADEKTTEAAAAAAQAAPPVPEQMNLLGTLLTNQRRVAFISGSPEPAFKEATVGTKIGVWTISAIDTRQLELTNQQQTMIWPIGKRLEREADGPWELKGDNVVSHAHAGDGTHAGDGAHAGDGTTSGSSVRAGGPPAGAAGKSDVLKKMMERRKKERRK
jgi:hypothetical protein